MNKDKLIDVLEANDFELINIELEEEPSAYAGELFLWFDYIGDKVEWFQEDEFDTYQEFYEYSRRHGEVVEDIFEELLNRVPGVRDFISHYEYEDYRVGYTNVYVYLEVE